MLVVEVKLSTFILKKSLRLGGVVCVWWGWWYGKLEFISEVLETGLIAIRPFYILRNICLVNKYLFTQRQERLIQ